MNRIILSTLLKKKPFYNNNKTICNLNKNFETKTKNLNRYFFVRKKKFELLPVFKKVYLKYWDVKTYVKYIYEETNDTLSQGPSSQSVYPTNPNK